MPKDRYLWHVETGDPLAEQLRYGGDYIVVTSEGTLQIYGSDDAVKHQFAAGQWEFAFPELVLDAVNEDGHCDTHIFGGDKTTAG